MALRDLWALFSLLPSRSPFSLTSQQSDLVQSAPTQATRASTKRAGPCKRPVSRPTRIQKTSTIERQTVGRPLVGVLFGSFLLRITVLSDYASRHMGTIWPLAIMIALFQRHRRPLQLLPLQRYGVAIHQAFSSYPNHCMILHAFQYPSRD
jgi:hypothetical protein